jgi:hypothetical protein
MRLKIRDGKISTVIAFILQAKVFFFVGPFFSLSLYVTRIFKIYFCIFLDPSDA